MAGRILRSDAVGAKPLRQTTWVGAVILPSQRKHRCVRVRTSGSAPTPDDFAEEIDDPFAAARPSEGAAEDACASTLARTLPPKAGGWSGRLGDVELAPPVRPRKILCVGRNYREHVAEMGNEIPDEPLLFFKPASALLASGARLAIPSGYERIDMEAELVAVIGRVGHRLDPADALRCVAGYTLGNDVSNRDLQRKDKQWTRAKGFDGFAPVGPFVRIVEPGQPIDPAARIQGFVDGERKQDAPFSAMIFDLPTVLAYVSACMTLEPGDLLYTGTPEGVSRLTPGCTTEVAVQGFDLGRLSNVCVAD